MPIAECYDKYYKLVNDIELAEDLIKTEKDSEMVEMLYAEVKENKAKLEVLTDEAKVLLLPPDVNDERTLLLKSEVAQVVRKQACLVKCCLECILAMLNVTDGRLKLLI